VGKIYNVGTGNRTTLLDLIQALREVTGKKIRVVHKDFRAGDVRHSCADTTAARELLGFTATHDLTSGLAKTLASMK
jgi:nucleoside-diphosphate-sugar epimerase